MIADILHGFVLTLLIYTIRVPLGDWWIKRFRYSPDEWLWCSLTYLKASIHEEEHMNIGKILILLAHAFLGWLLCFAAIGIGMAVTSLENALVIHAIAAPVIFTGISLFYFRKFNFTTPLQTATFFLAFVMTMDFFVVALLINHSLDMFTSLLGTWIPFALIFLSTYLTGLLTVNRGDRKMAGRDS